MCNAMPISLNNLILEVSSLVLDKRVLRESILEDPSLKLPVCAETSAGRQIPRHKKQVTMRILLELILTGLGFLWLRL